MRAALLSLLLTGCTSYGGTWYALTATDPVSNGDCGGSEDTAEYIHTSTYLTNQSVLLYPGEGDEWFLSTEGGTLKGTNDKGAAQFSATVVDEVLLDSTRGADTTMIVTISTRYDFTVKGDLLSGTQASTLTMVCTGPTCDEVWAGDTSCTTTVDLHGASISAPFPGFDG